MSVSYLGKKPSRFWTFRQNVKGTLRAFRQDDSKREAKAFRKETLKGVGIFAIGLAMNTVTLISAIPFVPFIGAIAALGGGFYFARNAKMKLKNIKNTTSFRNFISNAERRWITVQQEGGPVKSFVKKIKRGAQKTGSVLGTTLGTIGTLGAVTAGLIVSNVWPAATVAITNFVATALPTLVLTTATLATGIGAGVALMAGGFILRAKCRKGLKGESKKKKSFFNLPPSAYQTDDNDDGSTLTSKNDVSQTFTNTASNDDESHTSQGDNISPERREAAKRRAEARKNRRDNKGF